MTPWQKAKQWQDEHDTVPFEELLGTYLSVGYVWSTPQVFLLAREARWNAEEQTFEGGEHNCWFVHLAAGHRNAFAEFMRIAPHRHRYAAWCRRNSFEPRVYCWDKLVKKVRI